MHKWPEQRLCGKRKPHIVWSISKLTILQKWLLPNNILNIQNNRGDIMKRYWVFWGDWYYPSGGCLDDHADFDDLELAISFAKTCIDEDDWCHIFDAEEDKIVWRG
jgi:hypothetical protein